MRAVVDSTYTQASSILIQTSRRPAPQKVLNMTAVLNSSLKEGLAVKRDDVELPIRALKQLTLEAGTSINKVY